MSRSVNDLSRYPAIPGALLSNARVLAHRWAALPLWPKDAVIVEVGVALGDFSHSILKVCEPRRFVAIDRFDLHEQEMHWGKPVAEHFGDKTHQSFYEHRFASQIAAGQVEVMQGDSASSIASLPDESVDVFYVDADHRYPGVNADVAALLPKVKPEGWIVMNDYLPADTFDHGVLGVIQATNELMIEHGWEMAYFALAPIMYCDVGLRKAGAGRLPDPQNAALRQRVAELEAALEATHRSTCWRITAPLRRVKTLLGSRV